MTLLWWHWLVLGLLFCVAEVATAGGFFIIFFGAGALSVGGLAALGLAGPVWMQLLLFSVFSFASLLLVRSRLTKAIAREPERREIDTLVGEIGTVSDDLAPGAVGRVEVRGTAWSARNATASVLTAGQRCRVVRVEGLRLDIEPEGVRS